MQNENWFQEEDLEEGPSLGLSSFFSTALAALLLSPVISSSPGRWSHSHPDPPPTLSGSVRSQGPWLVITCTDTALPQCTGTMERPSKPQDS